jgi:hypothetical protein
VHIFVVINRKYDNIIKNNFTLDLEYIDFSPSSTLIKQYQVCLCNTSHVYILINLFDLCQHFFLHCYIHFFKCWHMLNEPFILSIIFDWSMVSTDRKTYLFSYPSELYYYIILILNAKQSKIILYYIIILSVNSNKNVHKYYIIKCRRHRTKINK